MATLDHIAGRLKAARKRAGLSQRALSAKVGIPQSHISRIEHGEIDLRLSSLLQISRFLGLEIMLVPRELVPAVQNLTRRRNEPVHGIEEVEVSVSAPPAYRLDDEDENG